MSSIPLYLKIKGSSNDGEFIPTHFTQTSPTSIEFQENQYDFTQVYSEQDTDYHQFLTNDRSSCVILIGPTGSGKTTMLKQLVAGKVKSFTPGSVPFVTAFEITNNKFILDLLDDNLRKRIPLVNYESHLKRERVNEDTMKHIFKTRLTQATEVNPNSSKSCLIITFYYMNHRTTFIDLMGNERNNVFANTSISSITQLLATKQNVGRSNNLITNMVFKNHEISMIMTLDPRGDVGLIKSALTNVANLLTNFKLSSPIKTVTSKRIPSYARPTLSSTSISKTSISKTNISKTSIGRTSTNKTSPKRIARRVVTALPKLTRPATSYTPTISKRNNPLVDKITDLEKTIENLQKLNSQLQQQLSTKEDTNQTEIQSLQTKIATQHEHFIKSISEIKSNFNEIKLESSTLINSFQLVGENINSISKKLAESEATVTEKTSLIEKLESDLTTRETEFNNLKIELDQLKQILQSNQQQSEKTIEEISNSKLKLTERVTDLQAQVDGKEDLLVDLNELLDKKNRLVGELQETQIGNNEKIENLSNEIKDLKNQLDLKIQNLQEFTANSESKQGEIDQFKQLNEQLSQEIEQLKHQLTEQQNDQQIEKLTQEKTQKTIEYDAISQKLEKLTTQHELELSSEKQSHCDAKSKWKQQIEELQLKITKKRQEIDHLNQDIHTKDEQISSLNNTLAEKTHEISKLKSEINTSNEQLKNWEIKYREMVNLKDSELKKLQDQLDYSTGDQLIHDLGYSGFNTDEIYQDVNVREFSDDMTISLKPPVSDITTILNPIQSDFRSDKVLSPIQSDFRSDKVLSPIQSDLRSDKVLSPIQSDLRSDKVLKPSNKLNTSPQKISKLGSSPLKKQNISPKKKRKNPSLDSIKAKYQKLSSPTK
ncbi:hypothetical protein JA1_004151 [Spathaspora sp. JA1]|nr:hypothetical protein JA1_004151 [Spathaspora sp. JA1]